MRAAHFNSCRGGPLQFGARRGPLFNSGPARPAAPTSYSGNARSLGPFPRHCRHCHARRLVVTRTLEERGGLEPLVHVSLPRLAWTRATRHCRFQPGRVVASGKRSRRTRKKRPRYRGFFRVRSVSSPWGIGVDCAQDCTQAHLARQRLYRVPPAAPQIFPMACLNAQAL